MTTQQKIEAIRQKCIEANPEIVELNEQMDHFLACINYAKSFIDADAARFLNEHLWTFRPIRLADVLLALHEAPRTKNVGITTLIGSMVLESFTKDDLRKAWNLYKDSLEEQSKETIDFIHNLVK